MNAGRSTQSSQRLTLAAAREVIASARREAEAIGVAMNIALVDEGNNLVAFAGGIPLERGGEVVGAIGVSGGSVDQDQAVAEAGAAAFT